MWILITVAGLFLLMLLFALLRKESADINRDNPYLHPEHWNVLPEDMQAVRMPEKGGARPSGPYARFVKRALDLLASFLGIVILSPVFIVLALAVWINDPGPIFFRQKRVGKNKEFFMLHKFRTMKVSTPHDLPTHQLLHPEQYITGVGKFLRKSSLDELPQIWDIFRGRMSVIGPRPALWNQADLVAEREKYGANDVVPGLTGWAQINGRDELEIPVKARLDGEYVRKQSLGFDLKCFIGTFVSVVRGDGVVEGGTGEMKRREEEKNS